MTTTCRCPSCGANLTLSASGRASPSHQNGNGHSNGGNLPPRPWTAERARAWVCPFRKHKGETLDQIAAKDPGYIDWMADECEGNAQRAARAYIDLVGITAPASSRSQEPGEDFNEFGD